MAMQEYHISNNPITAHAFDGSKNQLAICPNDPTLEIYSKSGNSWTLSHSLSEHDKVITGVDWAPRSNRIVTCSQDRNAYVWTLNEQTGVWSPTLVLLRLNRSATFVKWSPQETKFAVASGARTISVCQFDKEQNWWTSKHLKKPIRSTVLSVDWHPNGVLLAAGSADMKARVFSAYLKEVDQKPEASVWGSKLPFNTVCGEFSSISGGWVHGIAFSLSGDALAFASHDSSITVVYPSGPDLPPQAIYSVRVPSLPFLSLTWLSESSLVAAGHDYEPIVFAGNARSGWAMLKSLDNPSARSGSRSVSRSGLMGNEAFNRFKAADSRGISSTPAIGGDGVAIGASNIAKAGGERNTAHQNTITLVRPFEGQGTGEITKISTSGLDGRVIVWNVGGLAAEVGKMAIH